MRICIGAFTGEIQMAKSDGWAHCPICEYWVPAEDMVYDTDDDGRLIRICLYCLDEKPRPERPFVLDRRKPFLP